MFFLRYDKYCADHYANGHCNQGCNTEACGWDGLDCAIDTPPKLADGTLVIVVLLQPEELLRDLKGFLRSLGTLLHTNLLVKLDDDKKPMVYPYCRSEQDEIQNEIPDMKQRGKRELEKEVIGYVLHHPIPPLQKRFRFYLPFDYNFVFVFGLDRRFTWRLTIGCVLRR